MDTITFEGELKSRSFKGVAAHIFRFLGGNLFKIFFLDLSCTTTY